jgi:hypothetical protein
VLTVDELVKAVNIALGIMLLGECPSFDENQDGSVTVNELVMGVNAALLGCMGGPTNTPSTPVSPSITPTAHPTRTIIIGEPSVAKRAAGTVEVTGTAMLAFSNVFSMLIRQAGDILGGGSGGVDLPPVTLPCPEGGEVVIECSQELIIGIPPSFGPPTYDLAASSCVMTGQSGTVVSLDGSLSLVGSEDGDVCFEALPTRATVTIPSLTVLADGTGGTVSAVFSGVSGSVSLTGSDPDCRRNTVTAQLTGSMTVETKDLGGTTLNSTEASFDETEIEMVVEQFGDACNPSIFRTTVNGAATFTTGGNTFAATYTDYTLRTDRTSGDNIMNVSGRIESACFGTAIEFATVTSLTGGDADGCPRDGELTATYDETTDLIRFTSEGGVEIDLGNDGGVDETFNSCLNPQLFICPA